MSTKHLIAGSFFLLHVLTGFASEDYTNYIYNHDFSSYYRTEGWVVDMPGAQNKGWQDNSYNAYTNNDTGTSIYLFLEAWIPKGGTLGKGAIYQDITGLPNGIYTLEADVIACNQQTGEQPTGVYLFGASEGSYGELVYSDNAKPEHYSCTFVVTNGTARIGMRTDASTNINWMAFDNVTLSRDGDFASTATQVMLSQTSASMVVGEETTLTATVTASDILSQYVTWTTSNASVATVEDGKVIAQGNGTATITATAVGSTRKATCLVTVNKSNHTSLIINEIQVANLDQFIDPSFNYGSWVELYNGSSKAISLGGMYVSNDPADLKKFQLPVDAGIVPAYGFHNLWFDHHDEKGGKEYSDEAYKQVDFKLTYEGGVIYLSDPEGNLLLEQTYPQAISRVSYARTTDAGNTWALTGTPTPEASNAGSSFATEQLASPVVDHDATLFTSPFTFHVAIPAGATLRYTTNGSTPTLDNSYVSTDGTFEVGYDNAIYRFRLFQDGKLPSDVVTRTFIYKDRDYYLPIISVVTDERNLYDSQIGAYTIGSNGISGNGVSYITNRNRGWERPVHFEYLLPDEGAASYLQVLSQECDFEVCGGWTRNLYSPYASFRLKSGKYYLGQDYFPQSFYADKPYIKSKAIQVRNGGNDGYARIKDLGLHEIILHSGFYVDCQTSQPAHVFINGRYMMMFNIREPNNKHHAYSNYGIDTDEMDQFEVNGTWGYQQKAGTDEAFKRWWHLTQDLANDPTNDAIYAQICDLVDIDEFCNYMALECFVGSSDWLANSNNVKGYRSTVDGKFHLIYMDVDAGFAYTTMFSRLYESRYKDKPNNEGGINYLIDILLNMLEYEPFKKRFIDAFCIVDGSVYEPEFSRQIFDEMVERARKAMAMEGREGNLVSSANEMVNKITNNRDARMSNFESYFGLYGGSKPIKLDASIPDARLLINSQEVPRATFDGRLYAPSVITAEAPTGYRFAGWQRPGGTALSNDYTQIFDDSNETWNYYSGPYLYELNEDAWKTSSDAYFWNNGSSPFGYGSIGKDGDKAIDYNTTLDWGDDSQNKYPSYYFLKTFNLSQAPSSNQVYRLTCYVDDGCVVYVNGIEVGRYHLSGTPIYNTFTGSSVYEGGLAKEVTFEIPIECLQRGTNIIAASVHNCTGKSSDIYWSAGLRCYDTATLNAEIISTSTSLSLNDLNDETKLLTAVFEPISDDERLEALATPLKVNEVSAANTIFVNDYFKKNDWIELYNPTDTEIDAAGLYLSDNIEDPLKYQIPSNTIANTKVPAHGHLIVWADKLESATQLHSGFKLGNTDGELVVLTSSEAFAQNNAEYFASHPQLRTFADGLIYNAHAGDESVGRYPDGANTYYRMARPTIAQANSLRTYDTAIGTDPGFMTQTEKDGFTLDLVKGWNWVSHPLNNAIGVNQFKDYADRILSQTLESYYSSEANAMAGLLKTMAPATMYKINMRQAHTYQLAGEIPSTLVPINLRAGWNWIGYPASGVQAISTALAQAHIEEGDIVMSQSGFSTYSATDGWQGTLSSFVPGQGYLYKSASTKSLRFRATSAQAAPRLKRSTPQALNSSASQTLNRHAHPDVMGLIARLELNGQVLSSELFTIKAFVNGELRGLSEHVGDLLYMNLYGQAGDVISFKAVDEAGSEFSIAQTLTLATDVAGSRQAPMLLTLGQNESGISQYGSAFSSSPHLNLSTFYTLSGLFAGTQEIRLAPGIYIRHTADGKRLKVLVK